MKKFKKWTYLFVLLALIACAKGSKRDSEVNFMNNKSAVAESVEALNNAMVNPENALFEELVMEELSYGHSSGKVQNKEEFIDDLINGSFDFQAISISDQTIDIIGQTAIVRHILSANAAKDETPVEIRLGVFLVYQNQNNRWKLLARQAFKL